MTRVRHLLGYALCLVLASSLVACGGGDAEDAKPRCVAPEQSELAPLAGIYSMTEFTQNTSDCSAAGPSVLDSLTDKMLYLVAGRGALLVGSCAELETCRAAAAQRSSAANETAIGMKDFDCSVGDGSLYGHDVSSGNLSEGVCVDGASWEGFLIPQGNGALGFQVKGQRAKPYTPKSGLCDSAGAEAAAENEPCSIYSLITAVRAGDL